MQLIKIVLLSLLSFSIAGPVKRSAATIEAHIATVNSQLHVVDSDIKSFTGNFFQALLLISAVQTLETDFNTLTSDVTSTGALGAGDSATIVTAVNGLVSTLGTTLVDAATKVSEPRQLGQDL